MKKEASKKTPKWLWLVLALVAVVAVAGVVVALVFGGANNSDETAGGRPDLYWNVARQSHLDPVTGLSNREAAADGLFYITFAHDGEQVEYAVADKKTVNFIDSMDVMGLVFDNDDMVVDVIAPADIGSVISTSVYVQRADANMIIANSTITMNGMMYNLKITDQTEVYDVTGNGEFEGVKINPTEVGAMATIAVYGDSEKQATHIYVKSYPVESKIYWRADQFYNSTDKVTTREPGEDGAYAIPFFCDGELVTLKCKDKDIVTSIDKASWNYPHFGFRFDEDGYIVETLNSGIASRTILSCQAYDITQYDGQYFTATRLLKNDGQFVEGTITENTAIYDVSTAAKADGVAGRRVDSLQMGDRVCVWKDADGNVVLIYISVRLIDGPAYYRPTRKYSSTTAATTRKPNEQGVYEIELLREGDTEKKIYKTTDQAIATAIDQPKNNVLGLKVDENNNIIAVYDVYSLFGNGNFCRGSYVTDVTGSLANFSTATNTKGGVLATDCKVYNVSAIGDYGKETTLQVGDYVYAYKQPTGEVIHIYVIRRYTGEHTIYFNLERLYDTEAKKSTREPDADGWYWFDMMVQGKQVRLKTKDIELVNAIDAVEIRITALLVEGNVITDVIAAQYGTGGAKGLSGYNITAINSDGTVEAKHATNGKEGSFKMAEDCVVYNVSTMFDKYVGEVSKLQIGDMITAYYNMFGEAKVIFVRQRDTQDMYWHVRRYYDSTNEVTLREPDADGWYYFDLAVNGKVVTLKTQDKKVATSVDAQSAGFGLNLDGDVIKACVSYDRVKNVGGYGKTSYTVTKINGSKVSLVYTLPSASTTGKTDEIVLDKNVKIYDVSDASSADFGKVAKLQEGDVIRTYVDENKENHVYVYILARCTRKGGYMSYCDHCDQVVYWNPYTGSMASYNGHYYLASDRLTTSSQNIGSTARDFEVVLDLNGHTWERLAGRVIRVYRNETLTIMDSVGGGKLVGNGHEWLGGVIYINEGATLNLYSGTLALTDNEEVHPSRGGVVYMTSSTTTFNMYGGTISGGRSYARNDDYAAGGNVYIANGTFNMSGGTITGGKVFNGTYEKDNGDGTTTTKDLYAYGGNLYLGGSTVANITGGTISEGNTERSGGNIAILNNNVKLNVKNATITGGESGRYGGNLYGYGTTVMNDAVITEGHAGISGGNIYLTLGGNVTLNGKTQITDGTAGNGTTSGNGGNIYGAYESVLNINDKTLISGGKTGSYGGNIYIAANEDDSTGALTRKFTLNMNGGTITKGETVNQSGGNIYIAGGFLNISGGEITDGLCKEGKYGGNIYGTSVDEFNLSGGLISGGKAGEADYDILLTNKTLYMSISGGTVEGRFRVNCPYTIDVSGAPVLKYLDLFKGATDNGTINSMLTVGEMKEGASITLKNAHSDLIFTNPFDKAAEYAAAGYFKNIDDGSLAQANADNRLYLIEYIPPEPDYNLVYDAAKAMTQQDVFAQGGTVNAKCPYCDKDVQWTALEGNATGESQILPGGHYYLADSIENTTFHRVEETVCLHLNGHDVTSPLRNFYVDNDGVLTIMGDGEVVGGYTHSNKQMGANVDGTGILNLCGGTYTTTSTNPAIGARGRTLETAALNVYNGTLIKGNGTNTHLVAVFGKTTMNMYGGTITGGTNTGNGGNIRMMPEDVAGRTVTLNIYGGTISNGTAALGGNIYAAGTATSVVVNITGGTITGGSVYASNIETTTVNISGNPVIENLDLSDGTVIELGELAEGAAIAVTGDGVFTGTLDNAESYLTYISAYETGKNIQITQEGALSLVGQGQQEPETPVIPNTKEVCPHCLKPWAELEDELVANTIAGNENMTEVYTFEQSGHYRLGGNMATTDTATNIFTMAEGVTVVLDMNGYSINQNNNRRALYFNTAGDFYLLNSADTVSTINNQAQNGTSNAMSGASIYAAAAGLNVHIYDVTINASTSSSYVGYGSCVAIGDNTAVTMYSGVINGATENTSSKDTAAVNFTGANGTFTMLGGTVNAGSRKYAISARAGADRNNETIDIQGGTVNGTVYLETRTGNTIEISGNPVISNLNLSNGLVVTLGELTEGADITVTAEDNVPFTDVLENADSYTSYLKGSGHHKGVLVNADNKLIITAICPHCGVAMADITWTEIAGGTITKQQEITKDIVATSGEHYRLMSDLIYTNTEGTALNIITATGTDDAVNVVLDMNGYSIDRTAGKYRALYVGKYNKLTLVDLNGDADPSTVGQIKSVGTLAGSTVYADNYSTLNIYDITINGTTGSSTNAGGAIGMYTGSTVNLYSGTITAGNTTGNGTAVGVGGSGKVATFNVYGGTITGSVYDRSGNGTIYVEGAPVIAELDLTNGADVDLGTLKEGASIGVSAADNTPFTVAMENAADYLEYINAVATGKTVSVDANNCLVIVDDTTSTG